MVAPTDPDFFADLAICENPHPFFEDLRDKGPVAFEPHHQVAMVTTLKGALSIFNDADRFSACVGSSGPIPPLPFEPIGDDIGEQIDRHRGEMYCADLVNTFDRPDHGRARSLMMRLFMPGRLKENEIYLRGLAKRLVREALEYPTVEVVTQLGSPFAALVIADLLGVPDEDRQGFLDRLTGVPAPIGEDSPDAYSASPLESLHEPFTRYIEDRRNAPRGDVLSDLATAKYLDGEAPTVAEVVRVAVNLFAAGQETTARLLATTLRFLAEEEDIQEELRRDPGKIANFVEEVLRLDGPIKGTFRLARRTTEVEGVEVKAGTTIMVAIPTINRDPGRYDRAGEIVLDRPKPQEHLAFGRGLHTCPGAPLARVEIRVMLEELLAQTSRIAISEAHHGAEADRRFDYAPTYLIRGLNSLHIEMTPRR